MKLLILSLLFLVSCTKEIPVPVPYPVPTPMPGPGPAPSQTFKLVGKTVTIQGTLKPGAKFSVDDAKKWLQGAVDSIDAK